LLIEKRLHYEKKITVGTVSMLIAAIVNRTNIACPGGRKRVFRDVYTRQKELHHSGRDGNIQKTCGNEIRRYNAGL
jgi:hypothetical protein